MSQWTVNEIPSQTGRCALITGANSGIGYHTALELGRKGDCYGTEFQMMLVRMWAVPQV